MDGKNQNPNAMSQKKRFIRMIQERILSGELKPGDRLRPERELALETGISRSSVNQGILDLERQVFCESPREREPLSRTTAATRSPRPDGHYELRFRKAGL
jgi:DNA-binding FadR family transcriptional regulator